MSSANIHNHTNDKTPLSDLPLCLDHIPLFQRSDILLGKFLGRGRNSQVHAVDRIVTQKDEDSTGEDEGNKYVLKHLQHQLFENGHRTKHRREATNALADLVLEAMYLSKLRGHPNIISLCGLTAGGTSVLQRKNAKADEYFILLERLDLTLDQRIWTWRQQLQDETTTTSSCGEEESSSSTISTSSSINTVEWVVTKIRYAKQIANALSYLHDHQVLYRDLKPENLGLLQNAKDNNSTQQVEEYTIKLFDFGLARELDEPCENTTRVYSLSAAGTRRYMAPEIFNRPGKYNYKADTYSFSMVLFELLAMQKPYADFNVTSHEELVCRLGGRPRLTDIHWPHDSTTTTNTTNNDFADSMDAASRHLAHECESLLQQTWKQDMHERLSMRQDCQRLEAIIQKTQDDLRHIQQQQQQQRHEQEQLRLQKQQRTGLQQHFLAQQTQTTTLLASSSHQVQEQPLPPPTFLKTKTSTSEMTVATDPMAGSDSELEDDVFQRMSNGSTISGMSSSGSRR